VKSVEEHEKKPAEAAQTATQTQEWPRLRPGARSLLDIEWPPGFDEHGRHLLEECPEFKLYELYRPGGDVELEHAPAVEQALFRSLFRITDPEESKATISSAEERIETAKALLSMLRCAQKDNEVVPFSPGSAAVGTRAARTIGKLLRKNLEGGSVEDVANVFKTCVRAVFAHEGRLPDKRSNKNTPLEAVLISLAGAYFARFRKQPSKRELMTRMVAIGYDYRGKDRASKWRAAFDRAALSGLPDH
jgi:hypothetical protein